MDDIILKDGRKILRVIDGQIWLCEYKTVYSPIKRSYAKVCNRCKRLLPNHYFHTYNDRIRNKCKHCFANIKNKKLNKELIKTEFDGHRNCCICGKQFDIYGEDEYTCPECCQLVYEDNAGIKYYLEDCNQNLPSYTHIDNKHALSEEEMIESVRNVGVREQYSINPDAVGMTAEELNQKIRESQLKWDNISWKIVH